MKIYKDKSDEQLISLYVDGNNDIHADTESDEFEMDWDDATASFWNEDLEICVVNEDGGVFSYNWGYAYERFTDTLVVAPEGLEFKPYSLRYENTYKYYVPEMVYIARDGNDFYIQGLSFYFDQSWIKGTISGNTVTFENSQLVGGIDEASDYLVGGDSQGNMTESIVFNYDATAGELKSATAIIAESAVATSLESVYAYWIYPVFTKEKPKGPEVVVAPEGLKTDEWSINAMTNFGDPVSGFVNIGFDGADVYLQGLCTYLPESWIKGSLDGNTITFLGDT